MDVTSDAVESNGPRPSLAYGSPFAHLRFWLVAGFVIWLDLWSKSYIFRAFPANENHPFIPGFIDFHRSLNDGAVFGSFTGQVGLFVVASVFALGFVTVLFLKSRSTQWVTQVALALVFAGAVGNLYDRLFVKADVVSFVTASGRPQSMIGKIIEQNDEMIKVGDWPDGSGKVFIVDRDRNNPVVRSQGVVRDFIRFVPHFPNWFPFFGGREAWPWVFNIADAALVVGVGVLLISSWLVHHPHD